MSILNNAKSKINNITDTIKNPFTRSVNQEIRESYTRNDFPEGFQFEELGGNKERVKLNGNMMPHIPFEYGGEQRTVKEYYSGQSEPSIHILGPSESDLTITGKFHDKRFDKRFDSFDSYEYVSPEIAQLCDAIRIRGEVLRIWMGEFQRYGVLKTSNFRMNHLGSIEYELTFELIGFNAPINGKFIEKKKEVPFSINKELIAELSNWDINSTIPDEVPASIADKIRELTGTVAEAIGLVTGFVDDIISTTNDVQKATQRALGLIKHTQNKVREYGRFIGGVNAFDPNQALTARYEAASYYASRLTLVAFMIAFLQRYKNAFKDLINDLPLGRHFVKENDTLQTISMKYYETSDNWKKIYDHNNLSNTDLVVGTIIEIPRL